MATVQVIRFVPLRTAASWTYMADMAKRTTIILDAEDERCLREASRREGLSQSELIRRGIRTVTAPYRRRARPQFGWLKLSERERKDILEDRIGDREKE